MNKPKGFGYIPWIIKENQRQFVTYRGGNLALPSTIAGTAVKYNMPVGQIGGLSQHEDFDAYIVQLVLD